MIIVIFLSVLILTFLVARIHVLYANKYKSDSDSTIASRIVYEIGKKLYENETKFFDSNPVKYMLLKELCRTGLTMAVIVGPILIASLFVEQKWISSAIISFFIVAGPIIVLNFSQGWCHTGTGWYELLLMLFSHIQMYIVGICIAVLFYNDHVISPIEGVITVILVSVIYWFQWSLWGYVRYHIWNKKTDLFK